MTEDQEESLVTSFEVIAKALAGIHEVQEKRFAKQYPEHRVPRPAAVTHVPNDEDKRREAQGRSDKPIGEWLGDLNAPDKQPEQEEEDFVGFREREFLAEKAKLEALLNASPEDAKKAGQDSGSPAPTGRRPKRAREVPTDNPDAEAGGGGVESGSGRDAFRF